MENEIAKNKKNNAKKLAKNKQKAKLAKEREQYYSFYDDIKRGSGKVIDW